MPGSATSVLPDGKPAWRRLAELPNVFMKLGGLGMPFPGFEGMGPDVPPIVRNAGQGTWKPYIESCIELFGAQPLHV
jgi:L-fuconolactonase